LGTNESGEGFPGNEWALILGGSSGFGLATAKRFARAGSNVLIVHRDRRSALKDIQPRFDEIAALSQQSGAGFEATRKSDPKRLMKSHRESDPKGGFACSSTRLPSAISN
jgi:NAD(P)-dependent dehydrogenase (short-subunit alcohol dehydrogenase family)